MAQRGLFIFQLPRLQDSQYDGWVKYVSGASQMDIFILLLIIIIYFAITFFKKAAPYIILAVVLLYIYTLIKNIFIFTWQALTSVPGLIIIGLLLLGLIGYFGYRRNRCAVCGKKYRQNQSVAVTDGKVCLNCMQAIGVDIKQLPTTVHVEKTFTVSEIKALQKNNTIIDPLQRWEAYQAKDAASKSSTLTTKQVTDLRELKRLLDDGVITQADFDAKKKQILGI